jgi:hypothetical protein
MVGDEGCWQHIHLIALAERSAFTRPSPAGMGGRFDKR